jgi:hypothetical protein
MQCKEFVGGKLSLSIKSIRSIAVIFISFRFCGVQTVLFLSYMDKVTLGVCITFTCSIKFQMSVKILDCNVLIVAMLFVYR